jgi:hypothetical protein
MTPTQQAEVLRFTENMRTMLRYSRKMHPMPAEVGGAMLQTARILERRGFVSITAKARSGWRLARLTEAGIEAADGHDNL